MSIIERNFNPSQKLTGNLKIKMRGTAQADNSP